VLLFAGGCGGDDGDDGGAGGGADAAPETFSAMITLNGYGATHSGDTLYFALWDDADSSGAAATASKLIMGGGGGGGGGGSGGGMAVELADDLIEGHGYTLYWYADLDDNMACDMEIDHHWSLAVPPVTGVVELSHMHTLSFNGDCSKQE
jgi:hypothetical protein